MRKIAVFGLGLVLAVAGCATNPGYVGNWTSKGVPSEMVEEGMSSMVVYIQEAGAFSMMARDAEGVTIHGATGTWSPDEQGGISLQVEGSDAVEALLVDDDPLVISGGGNALEFERQD